MKFHLSFELLKFLVCITPISFEKNMHETFKNWTSFRFKEFAQVVNAYILWSYWCLWWLLQNRRKRNILMLRMLAKMIKKVFDAKYFKQSTWIHLKKRQSVNVERGSMNMFFCGNVWIIIGIFALMANQVHSLKKMGTSW
jgi:hypothetical protein